MRFCPTCRSPHPDGDSCTLDGARLLPEGDDPLQGVRASPQLALMERLGETFDGPTYRAGFGPTLAEVRVQVFFAEPNTSDLQRELAAASAVQHRWLQRLLAWGRVSSDGPLWAAFEAPAGRSLATELRQAAPLDEPRALRLGRRLASGLAHAHERGLVHGGLDAAAVHLREDDGEADSIQLVGRFTPASSDADFEADVAAAAALISELLGTPSPVLQRALRQPTARGLMRSLAEAGARAALEVAREPRPVLPEVSAAVADSASRALQRAGAAAAQGDEDRAALELRAATDSMSWDGSEALAARWQAAGHDPVELRTALEEVLAAAEHAAGAERPQESGRDLALGQFSLAGWLTARAMDSGRGALAERIERAFARGMKDALERQRFAPGAVSALLDLDGATAEQIRRALAVARDALEAPVVGEGQVLDDAAFERLKRDAFGNEQNALSRCSSRADVVAAVQQAIADASDAYASGDIGGASRTYRRACERLLSEGLAAPDCGELREYLQGALQQSRQTANDEEAAWAMRRALDGLLEMDARVST